MTGKIVASTMHLSRPNDPSPPHRSAIAVFREDMPLPADGTLVERQLLALENVPIAATALPGAAGHHGIQTGSLELPLKRRLNLASLAQPLLLLLLHALALLRLLGLLPRLLLPPAP